MLDGVLVPAAVEEDRLAKDVFQPVDFKQELDLALEPVAVSGDQRRVRPNRDRRLSVPFFLKPHAWLLSAHDFKAAAARLALFPLRERPGEDGSASGFTAKIMERTGQFGAFHPQTA
jgi:hypothetical protein